MLYRVVTDVTILLRHIVNQALLQCHIVNQALLTLFKLQCYIMNQALLTLRKHQRSIVNRDARLKALRHSIRNTSEQFHQLRLRQYNNLAKKKANGCIVYNKDRVTLFFSSTCSHLFSYSRNDVIIIVISIEVKVHQSLHCSVQTDGGSLEGEREGGGGRGEGGGEGGYVTEGMVTILSYNV